MAFREKISISKQLKPLDKAVFVVFWVTETQVYNY